MSSISIAAYGFLVVAGTADTDDKTRISKRCRVGACDEVVGLKNDAWRFGKAAAVSEIPKNTAAVSCDDDTSKFCLDFRFKERGARFAENSKWGGSV
jgi:hypothetical protein